MARQLLTQTETDLAISVLMEVDPDEELLLRQLMEPEPFRLFKGSRAIGFGVNEFIEVVSPAIMVIVPWAWAVAMSEFQDQTSDRLRKITRRAFGPKVDPPKLPTKAPETISRGELQALITSELIKYRVRPRQAIEIGETLSSRIIEVKHSKKPQDEF